MRQKRRLIDFSQVAHPSNFQAEADTSADLSRARLVFDPFQRAKRMGQSVLPWKKRAVADKQRPLLPERVACDSGFLPKKSEREIRFKKCLNDRSFP